MQEEKPLISVIIPVKNEEILLNKCLESLVNVDYPKDRFEIIIADGLSQDNTREVALRYSAKLVTNEKQVVVSGRNCGFKVAAGDIIAFTDADCIFERNWLKDCVKYFQDDKVGAVGGGVLVPKESSYFEKSIDFIFSIAGILVVTAHHKITSLAKEVRDIPGCNAFYRRAALEKVMPVDESFLTAEDVWMNHCIRNYGYKLIAVGDAILWHYRRNSVKTFFVQIYRFAIGRLQVGKRNPKLINFSHIIGGFAIPFFLIALISFIILKAMTLFLQITLVFLLLITIICIIKTKSLLVAMYTPFTFLLFIFAWSTGFLRELFFPLKDVRGK